MAEGEEIQIEKAERRTARGYPGAQNPQRDECRDEIQCDAVGRVLIEVEIGKSDVPDVVGNDPEYRLARPDQISSRPSVWADRVPAGHRQDVEDAGEAVEDVRQIA